MTVCICGLLVWSVLGCFGGVASSLVVGVVTVCFGVVSVALVVGLDSCLLVFGWLGGLARLNFFSCWLLLWCCGLPWLFLVGTFCLNWCLVFLLLVELWSFLSNVVLEAVVFFYNLVGGWLCSSLGVVIVLGFFVFGAFGVFLFCVGLAFVYCWSLVWYLCSLLGAPLLLE